MKCVGSHIKLSVYGCRNAGRNSGGRALSGRWMCSPSKTYGKTISGITPVNYSLGVLWWGGPLLCPSQVRWALLNQVWRCFLKSLASSLTKQLIQIVQVFRISTNSQTGTRPSGSWVCHVKHLLVWIWSVVFSVDFVCVLRWTVLHL